MRKFLLSFVVLVRLTNIAAVETDLKLGCEQLFIWHQVNPTAPVYAFLHCPDGSASKVQGESAWTIPHA